MNITRDKIVQAIQLKKWFAEQLAETCPNGPDLGLNYNQQNPEERNQQIAAFEETDQRNLFKEFLEELSEDKLRDLQAIGFYGRGQHKNFDLALEEANPMEQNAADVEYTMQLLAAGHTSHLKKFIRFLVPNMPCSALATPTNDCLCVALWGTISWQCKTLARLWTWCRSCSARLKKWSEELGLRGATRFFAPPKLALCRLLRN